MLIRNGSNLHSPKCTAQRMESQISALLQELSQKHGDLLQCTQTPLDHYCWSDNLLEKALVVASCASELDQILDQLHQITQFPFEESDEKIMESLQVYSQVSQQVFDLSESFHKLLFQDLLQETVMEALALKEEINLLKLHKLKKENAH